MDFPFLEPHGWGKYPLPSRSRILQRFPNKLDSKTQERGTVMAKPLSFCFLFRNVCL